jgi:hypothetical protein
MPILSSASGQTSALTSCRRTGPPAQRGLLARRVTGTAALATALTTAVHLVLGQLERRAAQRQYSCVRRSRAPYRGRPPRLPPRLVAQGQPDTRGRPPARTLARLRACVPRRAVAVAEAPCRPPHAPAGGQSVQRRRSTPTRAQQRSRCRCLAEPDLEVRIAFDIACGERPQPLGRGGRDRFQLSDKPHIESLGAPPSSSFLAK